VRPAPGISPFIVDAHAHSGYQNVIFTPETAVEQLLKRMDSLLLQYALHCGDMTALARDPRRRLSEWQVWYERAKGRIPFLGVFDPRRGEYCLQALTEALSLSGFRGVKIHPTFHGVAAEDSSYEPAWRFAADHDLPILAHTWSPSSHNPPQALSAPERFEGWVRRYPRVVFVMGHSGGRGTGRFEAIRMAREHPSVHMDFAGDIYCHRYVERMTAAVPPEKVLFGSDWPWMDPRSHLSRVYLAAVTPEVKRMILRDNALRVYHLEEC
jgi:predicted TIM-barrel fold metal-dependent hydrolase